MIEPETSIFAQLSFQCRASSANNMMSFSSTEALHQHTLANPPASVREVGFSSAVGFYKAFDQKWLPSKRQNFHMDVLESPQHNCCSIGEA